MFHFSVESRYVDRLAIDELESVGIPIDRDFKAQAIADVDQNFHKHGLSGEDAADVLNDMGNDIFLRVERYCPEGISEALSYIRRYFFHAPLCVWLDGQSYCVAGQYGENKFSGEIK